MLQDVNMTKTIRIEDEDNDLITNNADGRSAAEEVHRLLGNVTPLEKKIDALMSRMDTFMSHGQGGIRVYPMPVDKIDGKLVPRVVELDPATEEKLGFHRASVREEK